MSNKKFKALQDVSIGGVLREDGETFYAESNSGHITTALHFKQIKEVKAKAEDPEADAKAEQEAQEKAAAEAKAKAEADAKGNKK